MRSGFRLLRLALCLPVAGLLTARASEVRLWSRFSGFSRFDAATPELEGTLYPRPAPAQSPAVSSPRPLASILRAYSFGTFFKPDFPKRASLASLQTPSSAWDGLFFANYTEAELAGAVYAETGGLFPRQLRAGSVYDASTWADDFEPGGVFDLRRARLMVAETRKLNKRTHVRARPAEGDRLATRAWLACADAAREAASREIHPIEPGERLHFFIRQDGVGAQKAPYLEGYEPVLTYGPFVNVGGGDVPAGDATHIDFYVLPVRGR